MKSGGNKIRSQVRALSDTNVGCPKQDQVVSCERRNYAINRTDIIAALRPDYIARPQHFQKLDKAFVLADSKL